MYIHILFVHSLATSIRECAPHLFHFSLANTKPYLMLNCLFAGNHLLLLFLQPFLPFFALLLLAPKAGSNGPAAAEMAAARRWMDANRLGQLVEHFLQTEADPSPVLDFLTEALAAAMCPEIDAQIQRHSLRLDKLQTGANSTGQIPTQSSLDCWLAEGSSDQQQPNGPLFRKLRSLSREMAQHSLDYKESRASILDACRRLVHELWRLRRGSSSAMELFNQEEEGEGDWLIRHEMSSLAPFSANTEAEAVLALSSFSLLDHSQKEMPEEELHSLLDLAVAEDLDLAVRQGNLQKLLFVSPQCLARSRACFDLFLGHLHSLLPIGCLFPDTMHVLSRLLGCRDEHIWCRTLTSLCRVAPSAMRQPAGQQDHQRLGRMAKRSLVLFFRQIFIHGPRIWRSFGPQSNAKIVQSLMELLTAETSAGGGGGPTVDGFLATFAREDPKVDWIRPWLHSQQLRTAMAPKLGELVAEVLEPSSADSKNSQKLAAMPLFWAFQCCLLFHCVRQPALLQSLRGTFPEPGRLEQRISHRIKHFLSLAVSPPPHRHGFATARRAVSDGLLETARSDNGARLLTAGTGLLTSLFTSMHSHQLPARLQCLPLKVLLEVLVHCPSLPLSTRVLTAFADFLRYGIANEQRELATKVLTLMLQKFSASDLAAALPELPSTVPALLPKPDPSIVVHRRLMIASCLLPIKNAFQLKLLRRQKNKVLERLWLRQCQPQAADNSPAQPSCWLSFPMPLRPMDEERRTGQRLLLQFIGGSPQQPMGEISSREGGGDRIVRQSKAEYIHQRLDFLASDSVQVPPPPLSHTIFVLLTQPGLLTDFFRSADICHEMQRRFAELEAQKGTASDFLRFIGRLDILTMNLDFLVDLRRLIPNLASRLVQILSKFCSNSTGQLFLCALSHQIGLLLSHFILAASPERRFSHGFADIEQLQNAISDIPASLYATKEKKGGTTMMENSGMPTKRKRKQKTLEPDQQVVKLSSSGQQQQQLELPSECDFFLHNSIEPERALSLGLVETEDLFQLSLLPADDSARSRLALLANFFSPRWRTQRPMEVGSVALLRVFARRFWPVKEAEPGRPRLMVRPPPHSEWLPLVADYALGLGLVPRPQLRKQMAGLRLLAESPADWLLTALILGSNLNAESTNDLSERLLQRHEELGLDCLWPQLARLLDRPFDDQLLLRVFPLVLEKLNQKAAFRRVLPSLASAGLPSLLHLLLFYAHRAYLGILPLPAVADYLLLSILGGPDIQALHFCAVLAHICHRPEAELGHHSPAQLQRLFLRPEFLADFTFIRFAHLLNHAEEAEAQTQPANGEEQIRPDITDLMTTDPDFDEWI